MKILKYIIISATALFCALSTIYVYAADYSREEYYSVLSEYDTSFTESLDKESKSVLESMGLLDFDYDKMIGFSFRDFAEYFVDTVKDKADAPLKSAATVFVIICFSSLFQGMKDSIQDESMPSLYSTVSAIVVALLLISKLKDTIAVSVGSISVCAEFIYAFVPAFCIISAASGCSVSTFATNGMLLALGQAINYVSKNILVPLSNCFLALSICSGLRSELNLGSLVQNLKKYITTAISVIATGFVSILSLKTAVASKADVIGIRSVRFAINSVVPVIGGAISEGLLSIQAYSSMIKSSVGAFGIIAVAVIFLPSIISVSLWRFFLSICLTVADVFNDNSSKSILEAFMNSMLIINVLLILSMVTTIISFGILIAARGSV